MPDTGLQPPYLDPSQYPAYLDVQRKQMLAQALMGAFQQSAQTPPEWNSMRVVPKRSALSNIATLATALMVPKAQRDALNAQGQYFSGLYGGGQPAQAAAPTLAPPPADPNATSVEPVIARNGQSFAQATTPQQPSGLVGGNNYMLLTGDPRTSQALLNMMGPEKYGEMLAARSAPTDLDKKLTSAGITDPTLRRQIVQANLAKENYIAPTAARENSALVDSEGNVKFYNPAVPSGYLPTFGSNGQPTSIVPIPGGPEAAANTAGASKASQEANTPHYEPDPFHPGQFIVSYPPTPPALGGSKPNAPRGTTSNTAPKVATPSTAADLEGQKEGAKTGTVYASELSKNATGATEVRRSLAELRNLAAQSGPSGLNEGKMKLGTYMIAAGMSPESVSQFLGVDVGALQAAQKQTATLAVNTIHSMTSRGTNFDLETFMRNNPNMNMADPAAFNRVVDYMDNKAKQEIAKQKDFSEWKKGHTPDEWETGHTAHWLEKQNQDIDAGLSNSRPPLSSFMK